MVDIKRFSGSKVTIINQDESVPTFYANNVELFATKFDVRFKMGHIQAIEEDTLKVRGVATVYMSLAHAEAFAAKLNEMLSTIHQIDFDEDKPHDERKPS